MNAGYILIIDDDKDICELLTYLLERAGYETRHGQDGQSAMRLLAEREPDVLLLDTVIPEPNGMLVLAHARSLYPHLPVLMVTGNTGVASAVMAIKAGAWDYIPKPFENGRVLELVDLAMKTRLGGNSQQSKGGKAHANQRIAQLMGESHTIRCLAIDLGRVSHTNFSVIINGETGTGKELVAKSIHAASPRSEKPFIPIDCGAIPDTLIENELFGHERGAYTGANTHQIGKLEAANGGTLFLDEIANMSLSAQSKLLRALQERIIFRIGGTKPIAVDVRVLAASHVNLMDAVISGHFREDLYYRLNEYVIRIPPLRERPDDILSLAERFSVETCKELNMPMVDFSPDARKALLSYLWPGNVRELRAVVRRATLVAMGRITPDDLNLPRQAPSQPPAAAYSVRISPGNSIIREFLPTLCLEGESLKSITQTNIDQLERIIIKDAMLKSGHNKAEVARRLKIDYKTLYSKLKKLQLTEETPS
ncbi:MAG: sigma-54-dependent transcriptional regulator [Methylococcus sp.]